MAEATMTREELRKRQAEHFKKEQAFLIPVRIDSPNSFQDWLIHRGANKVIGVGFNYRDHLKEGIGSGKTPNLPKEPILFAKTPNCLIGPEEPIILPRLAEGYGFDDVRTDLEAELAVIMYRRCRNIPAEDIFDYIFGYTCFNDVSQRNIQNGDVSGWFRGKSFDTFGPIGPRIVTARDMPNPQRLSVCSRINGVVKQSGNTADMIFPVAELVSYISRHITLERGDIIATGTPAGVSPIKPGDIVEIEIEEIGVLRNPVIAETR